jgi:general secretion pathway protein B
VSFILDALRKSEDERQRAAVPEISRIPAALPKPRLPSWALALMLLLCVSVAALSWGWWRSLRSDAPIVARSAQPPSAPLTSVSSGASPLRALAGKAAPAPEPAAPKQNESVSEAHVKAAAEPLATSAELPSAAELAAQGVMVPDLELQLHVFSDDPAQRFVFIDGSKYGEGDALPTGPQIVEITADGVVFAQHGQEFFVPRN